MKIAFADSDADVGRCFAVMSELRPHLVASEFVATVKRLAATGYHLAYLEHGGDVRAVAGFRFLETLAWGKILYVDDLVTRAADRSRGYGAQLFDRLVAHARAHACEELHLDSGVQRFAAHRFYGARRMDITAHHFALKLQ